MNITLRREHGNSPNGNPFNGRWVARLDDGSYVDHDKYRNDLIPRLEGKGYSVSVEGE